MSDYGYVANIATVGNSRRLIASDFENVRWKVGGVTLDWSTVVANVADVVLTGGTTVLAGQKYIPMGTVLVRITASGKYGPADTTASDGRQTVDATTRSKTFLLDEDIVQNPVLGLVSSGSSDHPAVFDGGTVWKSLVKVGGTGQPTLANFLLAFPAIDFAEM